MVAAAMVAVVGSGDVSAGATAGAAGVEAAEAAVMTRWREASMILSRPIPKQQQEGEERM